MHFFIIYYYHSVCEVDRSNNDDKGEPATYIGTTQVPSPKVLFASQVHASTPLFICCVRFFCSVNLTRYGAILSYDPILYFMCA